MKNSGSRIAILGGSGFIGASLSAHLRHISTVPVEGYTSSDFDLTDVDCVDTLCKSINRDTILIVAARARQAADPFSTFTGDVAIATNVARCLSKTGVKKCVYFSTTSVYGDMTASLSITEETKIAATSLYGISKFTAECILKYVTEKDGIPIVILRPCMVYGPGDTSQAYGPARFIRSILREGQVRLLGDGSEGRDYLFIRDLVTITSRLALGDFTGTYNLATGQMHTFQELVAQLRVALQMDFNVVHLERDRTKVDQRINPAKLFTTLPDVRLTDWAEGLRETCDFFAAKPAS